MYKWQDRLCRVCVCVCVTLKRKMMIQSVTFNRHALAHSRQRNLHANTFVVWKFS